MVLCASDMPLCRVSGFPTGRNRRRFKSIGANSVPWLKSISACPMTSTPVGLTEKYSRPSTRAWASAVKYMRVLRHISRSTREIGTSLSRSWRPKITARRISRLKA